MGTLCLEAIIVVARFQTGNYNYYVGFLPGPPSGGHHLYYVLIIFHSSEAFAELPHDIFILNISHQMGDDMYKKSTVAIH